MYVQLAFVSFIFTAIGAAAGPACVVAANGKMLCCPENDHECFAKVEAAHGEPETPPPLNQAPAKPWLMGSAQTFAGAPFWDFSSPFDVAVVGMPFGVDLASSRRRESSRIPAYSRSHDASLQDLNIVDGQDLIPVDTPAASELQRAVAPFFKTGKPVLALGGDQSITIPLLRAAKEVHGDFAIIHIDKDLAMGSGSREEGLAPGSALYWAAAASLVDTRHSLHVGLRGNLPSKRVELIDQELGFKSILAEDFAFHSVQHVVQQVKDRLERRDGTFMPAYISLDLDVLDPMFVPATGDSNSEVGGLSVLELRALLVGLKSFCRVVGADLRGAAALLEPPSAVRVAATLAHDLVLLAGRQHLLGTHVVPPPLKT
eukprot:CAMPEP_0117557810 /NCGR_PEP_ID=MMETSP0784-20121206/52515_1 /TAXON_ID=39447 /ORGANISM="" /LENGTH=372 /DNA_ID=CAMNT_0005355125 /DNA_START=19 /DNA_END=1138 /DNA_ORIENTATION=-